MRNKRMKITNPFLHHKILIDLVCAENAFNQVLFNLSFWSCFNIKRSSKILEKFSFIIYNAHRKKKIEFSFTLHKWFNNFYGTEICGIFTSDKKLSHFAPIET